MATASSSLDTSATSLAVTNLHSRATGEYWKSASINFTTNSALWVDIQVKLVGAGTGAGSASGYSDVWLARSQDNTTFDANISAGDAQWTSTNPTLAEYSKSLYRLGRIPMGTTQTASYTWVGSFIIPIGEVPNYGVVVIGNFSNKAYNSTGSTVTYIENKITIA
jgi:hypothetical protein